MELARWGAGSKQFDRRLGCADPPGERGSLLRRLTERVIHSFVEVKLRSPRKGRPLRRQPPGEPTRCMGRADGPLWNERSSRGRAWRLASPRRRK